MSGAKDRWARWLLDGRHGGDPAVRARMLTESLHPWRDELLDRARLGAADTLLDVGTGDGLIAFGALDRLGPDGRVIFSDISQDLLDHCRATAEAAGLLARCSFARAPADHLDPVADASVDVVTTRSVLIYVKDKAAALAEFHRVLRPGGRVSLFEPVNKLMTDEPGRFAGYDAGPVAALAGKVRAAYAAIQPEVSDPMLDFDERDLVRHAERAGFPELSLDLRWTVTPKKPSGWARFLNASANPLVPSLGEVIAGRLTAAEAAEFTAALRPLVEAGHGRDRTVIAFLTAVKGQAAAPGQAAGQPDRG
jgi:ubiquinone/menaquinone biosynthesis C-methylase UbiE